MVDGIEYVFERVGGVVASMRIYCSDEQPKKALFPILVSVSGRFTYVSNVQFLQNP